MIYFTAKLNSRNFSNVLLICEFIRTSFFGSAKVGVIIVWSLRGVYFSFRFYYCKPMYTKRFIIIHVWVCSKNYGGGAVCKFVEFGMNYYNLLI